MKIKSDNVPEGVEYLTSGKVYECEDIKQINGETFATITNNFDNKIRVIISECAHLDYEAWDIVE